MKFAKREKEVRIMENKKQNTPDRARSEAGGLNTEDLLRISQRILGILEEEHCTVAQVAEILHFTNEAASTCTLVKCVSISANAR